MLLLLLLLPLATLVNSCANKLANGNKSRLKYDRWVQASSTLNRVHKYCTKGGRGRYLPFSVTSVRHSNCSWRAEWRVALVVASRILFKSLSICLKRVLQLFKSLLLLLLGLLLLRLLLLLLTMSSCGMRSQRKRAYMAAAITNGNAPLPQQQDAPALAASLLPVCLLLNFPDSFCFSTFFSPLSAGLSTCHASFTIFMSALRNQEECTLSL